MKGRLIVSGAPAPGIEVAGCFENGALVDLRFVTPETDTMPLPGAIYSARIERPARSMGGAFVDLGPHGAGFLRAASPPDPGTRHIVQVSGTAEPGKAPPVTDRIALRRAHAVLTPGRPGRNIARSLREPARRAALAALADAAMAGDESGLILRSAAADCDDAVIRDEIAALRACWDAIAARAGQSDTPGRLCPAPAPRRLIEIDWDTPDAAHDHGPDALGARGLLDALEALRGPAVPLPAGSMFVEPTRALVAVDINAGEDFSPAAGEKANRAAFAVLPRALRLRGLGGQIVIDPAPMRKSRRRALEAILHRALSEDATDSRIAGWTPLGLLECQRKRARLPLTLLLRALDAARTD